VHSDKALLKIVQDAPVSILGLMPYSKKSPTQFEEVESPKLRANWLPNDCPEGSNSAKEVMTREECTNNT
jgi:hypothetical protein